MIPFDPESLDVHHAKIGLCKCETPPGSGAKPLCGRPFVLSATLPPAAHARKQKLCLGYVFLSGLFEPFSGELVVAFYATAANIEQREVCLGGGVILFGRSSSAQPPTQSHIVERLMSMP